MVKKTHIIIFLLLLILFFVSFIPINVISIHCIAIPELDMNIRVRESKILRYTYIFTNENVPVEETFKITPQSTFTLVRVEMDNKSDKVVPEFLLGEEEFKLKNNKYIIEDINKEFKHLELLVQSENKNTLIINDKKYLLSDYVKESELITIENKKIPAFKYITRNMFY